MADKLERVSIPSSFPRVVFNRLKSKSKNGKVIVLYSCSSFESYTENGQTKKTNVKRIGLIRSESGLGEIEFNYRFLKLHPEFDNLVVRRVTTEKKGRNSVEVYKRIGAPCQRPASADSSHEVLKPKVSSTSQRPNHPAPQSGGQLSPFNPNGLPANTVKYGLVYFLMLFIDSTPSGRALKRACFNKKSLFNRILSLICFIAVHGINRLYDMELWAKDHLLPANTASFDKDCIARIMSNLDSQFIHHFYRCKHELISTELKNRGIPVQARTVLALDGTNFDVWAKNLLAEYGNNKSGSDAKIMNLLVLMDQESSDVYYHQTLAGNVADITTLESAVRHCELYQAWPIMLVADRGYWSVYNVSVCYAHNVSFLLHVKLHSTALKKMIAEKSSSLMTANNCVLIEHKKEVCLGIKLEREWSWYCADEKRIKRSKINFYVYFNMELYQAAIVRLHKKVSAINQALSRYKQACAKASRDHSSKPVAVQLTLEQEKLISKGIVKLNTDSGKYDLNEELARTHCVIESCWMLASDRELEVEQAFTIYRQRNQIESLNRDLKNNVGLDTNGAQTRTSYEARQFLGILAAEMHMQMRHRVTKYNETHPQNEQAILKHNSVHCTLMDLENIEATFDGNTTVPTSNLSLNHYNLFRACGLDPVDLKDERLDQRGLEQGVVESIASDDCNGSVNKKNFKRAFAPHFTSSKKSHHVSAKPASPDGAPTNGALVKGSKNSRHVSAKSASPDGAPTNGALVRGSKKSRHVSAKPASPDGAPTNGALVKGTKNSRHVSAKSASPDGAPITRALVRGSKKNHHVSAKSASSDGNASKGHVN